MEWKNSYEKTEKSRQKRHSCIHMTIQMCVHAYSHTHI